MQIGSVILLIIKNWKYVVQFIEILERNVSRGIEEKDLLKGLEKLEKGFGNVQTIKDTADAARDINDSFRL